MGYLHDSTKWFFEKSGDVIKPDQAGIILNMDRPVDLKHGSKEIMSLRVSDIL